MYELIKYNNKILNQVRHFWCVKENTAMKTNPKIQSATHP